MRQHGERDPWEIEDGRSYQANISRKSDIAFDRDQFPDGRVREPYSARSLWVHHNVIGAGMLMFYYLGLIFVWIMVRIPGLYPWMITLPEENQEILSTVLSVLVLLAPALFVASATRMPAREAFPIRRVPVGIMLAGICCGMGSSVIGVYLSSFISNMLSALFGVAPTMPELIPDYMPGPSLVVRLLAISFVPAIFEEILFRGAVMQSLRRFGDGFALVFSSFLFALAHRNLVQGPNAFVAGLVLGYFAMRTGSLLTSIMMHLANNGAAAIVSVMMMRLPEESAMRLNFSYFMALLALGFFGVLLTIANGGFVKLRKNGGEISAVLKTAAFFTAPLAIIFLIVTFQDIISYFE